MFYFRTVPDPVCVGVHHQVHGSLHELHLPVQHSHEGLLPRLDHRHMLLHVPEVQGHLRLQPWHVQVKGSQQVRSGCRNKLNCAWQQGDQIGRFLMVLATNFRTKVAQIYGVFGGLLNKLLLPLLTTFGKHWTTIDSHIWSHCLAVSNWV